MPRLILGLLMLLVAMPASAEDAGLTAAKQAAAALGRDGVVALQRDLILTGDLNSAATGEFGPRSYEAVKAFQRRAKAKPTGIMDARTRRALADQAAAFAAPFDLRSITVNGVTVEYPAALATVRTEGRRGPKFSAPDGGVTVDILAYPATQEAFDALYDRLRKERDGRKVPLQVKREGVFSLGGSSDGKSFYMRFLKTDTDTRGFVLGWPPEDSPAMDRIAVIMAGTLAAAAADAPEVVSDPRPPVEPLQPVGPPVPLAAGEAAGPREGPGVVVSTDGVILTRASLIAGCETVTTGLGAGRVLAGDRVNDIALVRLDGPGASRAAVLRRSEPAANEPITLARAPGETTEATISALDGPNGDTRRFRVAAAAPDGALFAPDGALIGPVTGAADGEAIGLRAAFVSAFLRANGVALATGASAGPAAMVSLSCEAR